VLINFNSVHIKGG